MSVPHCLMKKIADPPITKHLFIPNEQVLDRQVFVIGDVHGCLDELVLLLDAAGVTSETLVILLGDLINKGPKSLETLDFVINRCNFLCVRGNNEDKILRSLQDTKELDVQENEKWILKLSDIQKTFLTALPYTISIPLLNSIFVHAGLIPGIPLHKQNPVDLLHMRNIHCITSEQNERRYIATKTNGQEWASYWNGPEHVYFGHDARRKLQLRDFSTGLDTGCVYGFDLTGIYATGTKEMFSVKALKMYEEPDELC